MNKTLSLLLFVIVSLSMSLPLYAGEFVGRTAYTVKMFNGDRGDFLAPGGEQLGTQSYLTQVLETRGAYIPADGYSLNWWVEAANGGLGYNVGSEDTEITYKYIFGKWDTELFSLSAGYLDTFFGLGYNFNESGFGGVILDLKASSSTTVTLLASILDENTDYTDGDANAPAEYLTDDGDAEDDMLYGVQLTQKIGQKSDKVNLYVLTTDTQTNNNLGTFGVAGAYSINTINISGEAATFFGDNGLGTNYTGLAANLGATMPINDTLSTEFRTYYAPGNDDDKQAIYTFMKKGMRQPLQQGLGLILDHDDGNLQLLSRGLSIYDLSQNEAGVYAAALSGAYNATEKTTLNAGIILAMPELDSDDAGWENLIKLNASVIHKYSKYMTVGLGASYMTADNNDATTPDWEDDAYGTTAFLQWAF